VLDASRLFVICINCLGSPHGSGSPITYKDGDPSKGRYGPEFPLTTMRDDVKYARPSNGRIEADESSFHNFFLWTTW
jgi:homoserine acetyltransferase